MYIHVTLSGMPGYIHDTSSGMALFWLRSVTLIMADWLHKGLERPEQQKSSDIEAEGHPQGQGHSRPF